MTHSIGNIVLYVDEFDADFSAHPNESAAIVTKIHPRTGLVDLVVFATNGLFFKTEVPQGGPTDRGTWH